MLEILKFLLTGKTGNESTHTPSDHTNRAVLLPNGSYDMSKCEKAHQCRGCGAWIYYDDKLCSCYTDTNVYTYTISSSQGAMKEFREKADAHKYMEKLRDSGHTGLGFRTSKNGVPY